jgi:rubrerythrin
MKPITIGANRTGIATSPADAQELIELAGQIPPSAEGSEQDAARVRTDFASGAGAVGSVPPPVSVKGVVTAAARIIMGKAPALLLDKLGERLAFERSGTRLYEALLAKLDASGTFEGGPSREELEVFRDEELRHFEMLRDAIEELGADPTAQTPGADLAGVAATGPLQIIVDPRTSLPQSLEALLIAELTDNDSWRLLIEIATIQDQQEMAAEFRVAEQEEQHHLESCRRWLLNKALESRVDLREALKKSA